MNLGQRSKNNIDSFISSKWGGIIVYNPPENLCFEQMTSDNPVEFSVNSNDVMQIMLYLLRKLMDIQNNVIIKNTLNISNHDLNNNNNNNNNLISILIVN